MSIAIEQSDERFYLVGPTFSLKEKIKSLGCKFDTARRQWYASEKSVAENIISLFSSEKTDSSIENTSQTAVSTTAKIVKGKASYKGHEYYLLDDTKKNDRRLIKLVFRDGSKVFWAGNPDDVEILASYKHVSLHMKMYCKPFLVLNTQKQ